MFFKEFSLGRLLHANVIIVNVLDLLDFVGGIRNLLSPFLGQSMNLKWDLQPMSRFWSDW